MRDTTFGVIVLGLTLLACKTAPPTPPLAASLQNRVVNELGCPAARVLVTPLGAGAYKVDACGHRATYSCTRRREYLRGDFAPRVIDQCIREPSLE
ncbi:MAG: hypothetical protein HYV09_06645 [Deltaproteobacteria bacterium]|nr:hypothetical protein [Deltaproteobacteria bacterium]